MKYFLDKKKIREEVPFFIILKYTLFALIQISLWLKYIYNNLLNSTQNISIILKAYFEISQWNVVTGNSISTGVYMLPVIRFP